MKIDVKDARAFNDRAWEWLSVTDADVFPDQSITMVVDGVEQAWEVLTTKRTASQDAIITLTSPTGPETAQIQVRVKGPNKVIYRVYS